LFHNAINKYGWGNFIYDTICECGDRYELDELEHHYIKQYHSHVSEGGYNLTWGFGNTTTGYKFTKEQKLAQSKRMSGIKHPEHSKRMMGMMMKPEARQKLLSIWFLIDPMGAEYTVDDLIVFCKYHQLTPQNVRAAARRENGVSKGWKCLKVG
jgi:hypothetical protein